MTRRGLQIVKGGREHHAWLPLKQTANRYKYIYIYICESDQNTMTKYSEADRLSGSGCMIQIGRSVVSGS